LLLFSNADNNRVISNVAHAAGTVKAENIFCAAGKVIDPLYGLPDNEGENIYESAEMTGYI